MRRRSVVCVVAACVGVLAWVGMSRSAAGAAPERVSVEASPWAHGMAFALVLPDGFDERTAYPVAVLLPPGRQDRAMVDAALETYVRDESSKRGWVVVAASAPEGVSWSDVPAAEFERLLLRIGERVGVESGRFHLIGVSSGGCAALRFAVALPDRCASVTVLPGYLEEDQMPRERVGVPMRGFVGERDEAWKSRTLRTAAAWREAGGSAEVEVVAGQDHILKGLTPRRLFESLEQVRKPSEAAELAPENLRAEAKIWGLLDAMHAAAARGDEAGYFACFDGEAVYLGTDPDERWTVEGLRERCRGAFSSGKGWTFRVQRRSVHVGACGAWAWFDEDLSHGKYGRLRGVGVAVQGASGWKVGRYAVSVPIPNRDLEHLTTEIRR